MCLVDSDCCTLPRSRLLEHFFVKYAKTATLPRPLPRQEIVSIDRQQRIVFFLLRWQSRLLGGNLSLLFIPFGAADVDHRCRHVLIVHQSIAKAVAHVLLIDAALAATRLVHIQLLNDRLLGDVNRFELPEFVLVQAL